MIQFSVMRGTFVDQGGLFRISHRTRVVPVTHPLRKIREIVRDVLGELTRSLGRLYASEGRPSIPPEQLLSALLLQVFYGIRSERQLMEQLDYNLLRRLPENPNTALGKRAPASGAAQLTQYINGGRKTIASCCPVL